MAVQPFLIQKQKEPEEKKKDALDYLLIGLDVANKGFGIASSYQTIQNAQANRDLNALEQTKLKRDLNLQASGYKPTDTTDKLKVDERTPGAAKVQELAGYEGDAPKFKDGYYVKKPKADYGSQKEVDELVSKGNLRYGVEGEKGAVKRSVLLPSNEMGSVLLVDTGPEKLAADSAKTDKTIKKDLEVARINSGKSEAGRASTLNAADTKRFDDLNHKLEADVQSSRSTVGRASNGIYTGNKILQLTDQIKAQGGKATEAQMTELATSIDSMIKGGASTVSGVEHMLPKTLANRYGNMATFFSSNPQPQEMSEFVHMMEDTVGREIEVSKKAIGEYKNRTLASYGDLKKKDPEKYDAIMSANGLVSEGNGDIKSSSLRGNTSGLSDGDHENGYIWASKNILSPDAETRITAEKILKEQQSKNIAVKNKSEIPSGGIQAPVLGFGRR